MSTIGSSSLLQLVDKTEKLTIRENRCNFFIVLVYLILQIVVLLAQNYRHHMYAFEEIRVKRPMIKVKCAERYLK